MYTICDRKAHPALGSAITQNIPAEDWPFTIDASSPPFALGKVVALVRDKELAEKIIWLLNEEATE